jgi:hypothetical protein
MSAITGLLGIGGKGASFNATAAPVVNPFTPNSNTMNADQVAANQTTALNNVGANVAGQVGTGLAGQNAIATQMQGLAGQLGQQAAGQGPNPALAQLAATTGQNVSAQNALMAGQRGSSANAGLIARQAAQQGAATQQQAVGQGAVLSAQQQIAAEQALQAQQQQQANLATQQVGQGVSAANTATGASQAQANLLGNQLQGYNQSNVSNASQQNSANAGLQSAAMSQKTGVAGLLGLADGGVVPASGVVPFVPPQAGGGISASYAGGGDVAPVVQMPPQKSFASQFLSGAGAPDMTKYTVPSLLGQGIGAVGNAVGSLFQSSGDAGQKAMESDAETAMAGGGTVPKKNSTESDPSLQSETEDVTYEGGAPHYKGRLLEHPLSYDNAKAGEAQQPVQQQAKGGAINFKPGGKVPGQAKVKGDSYANDTVPAKLSPGEVVIPRSVMNSHDPVNGSAQFVAAVLAKRGRR